MHLLHNPASPCIDMKLNCKGNLTVGRKLMEVGNSPILKKAEEWRPKVQKQKDDTIFLNIDEDGKTTKVSEEEMNNPSKLKTVAPTPSKGLLEYKSDPVDRDWAGSGLVATIVTGETSLSIQQRVEDAGFINVEFIPMGGDRLFLRSRNNEDVWTVFNKAIDFEQNIDGSQQQSGHDFEHDGRDVDALMAGLNKEWHTNDVPIDAEKHVNSKENGTAVLKNASFHDNNTPSHDTAAAVLPAHLLPGSSSHTCNVPKVISATASKKKICCWVQTFFS